MLHLMLAVDVLGIAMVVVGFGGLIFIHELGHYLACRVTGTRVEAFSIGFGPKLLGWRRGHTVYKISAIPLGGYVKMAAENPGEKGTGAPDEFPQKSFSQRLLIMSAGVVFNGILAFLLFVWAFGLGTPFLSPEIGVVGRGGAAWEAGLKRGDVVRRVNDYHVLSFDDLAVEVALSGADEELEIEIERGGEPEIVRVTPRYSEDRGMPAIDVGPAPGEGAAAVREGSPAAKAGGRKGDRVIAVGGAPAAGAHEANAHLLRLAGLAPPGAEHVETTVRVRRPDGSEEDLAVKVPVSRAQPQVGIVPFFGRRITRVRAGVEQFRKGDVVLAIDGRPLVDFHVFTAGATGAARVSTVTVRRDGEERALSFDDMTDEKLADAIYCGTWDGTGTRVSPRPGMPADRAGMETGDVVLRVGSKPVASWSDIQGAILDHGGGALTLRVKRGEEELDLTIEPAGRASLADLGYVFEGRIDFVKESRFLPAVGLGWERTVRSIRHVVYTLKNLLTARVSARHVGGPIAIAQMTYGMFEHGFAKYLYFLALISVNLAILNLLPIPVLDGGQIVLLTAEKIRGEPLPEKVVGYLQLVGVVLILSLIALALTNDISNLFR